MAKSVLITGCSSGIGYDAAQGLRERGWRVFASCRKQVDCDRLRAMGFDTPRIDYEDEASIESGLAEVLAATGGTLDAVFNNGAYAIPGAVEDISRDAMRAIFEANLFGVHDLTCRIIPVMRAQGHGRIINNSSILGFSAMRMRGAYNATKFAMEGLTDTMRLELAPTPIEVVLIEPGPITTKIRRNSQPQFEHWVDWEGSALRNFYEKVMMPRLYADEGPPDTFELPPAAVTKKLIHALESRRPHPRYYVTTPTYFMGLMKRLLPTRLLDKLAIKAG